MDINIDDNTGWTIFGVSFLITFIIIVFMGLSYNRHKNQCVVEMVKSGSDPIVASVAVDNIYDDKAKTYFISKGTGE